MPSPIPASLQSRLESEEAVFGAWLFLSDAVAAQLATHTGFDYVCIDMQHGFADLESMMTMLTAIETGGAYPIVRATVLEGGLIGRIIDAGALGVIVPMVNTVEQAKASVSACRYAPVGTRSVGPMGAITRYGGAAYMDNADDLVTVMPMIETVEAVGNVEAIAAVPGVGALYVGPADLSLSMGLESEMDQDDADFDAALLRVVAACEANKIIPGIQATPELVTKRREQGFTMITVGYDYQRVRDAFQADLASARDQLKG